MKIALFSDTFSPQINGVANTALNSARVLAEFGHEVRVYTVSKESGKKLTEESLGKYKVITIPSSVVPVYPGERFSLPLGFTFRSIKNFRPDIIHVHTPFSVGFEGTLASKVFRIPIVGTHHTFFDHYLRHVHLDFGWARKLSWKSTVFFYNRMDLVISPTKSLRDELLLNGLKKPVEILSNSINFQVFQNTDNQSNLSKETLKKKFGITGKSVVYMGRVSYEKSIDEVVRAFAGVVRSEPLVKLMIVGDGPEKEKLIALTKQLGIKDSVVFTGFVKGRALVDAIKANDVFVTASKSENMPLSVLEAEAVGLPVIAVSSLGLSEIVEDGRSGFLLPDTPELVENLTKSILKIINDDKLREGFSKKSLELSQQYSESEITKKLIGIYQSVINSKK